MATDLLKNTDKDYSVSVAVTILPLEPVLFLGNTGKVEDRRTGRGDCVCAEDVYNLYIYIYFEVHTLPKTKTIPGI